MYKNMFHNIILGGVERVVKVIGDYPTDYFLYDVEHFALGFIIYDFMIHNL